MPANRNYDLEQLTDEVVTLLTAELPAAIIEINNDKGDLPLTDPEKINFGGLPIDPRISQGKSTVDVLPSSQSGMVFNEGLTEDDTFIDVMLNYWDADPEVCERKILRYGKALRKVLDGFPLRDQLDPPPDNVGDSVVSEIRYTLIALITDTYAKSAVVRIKLRTDYTYK